MTDPDGYDADVLILGGSFTGVELVRLLRKARRGRKLEIIVVDRQRSHPYIPLGHELLTERMAAGVSGETELETAGYVESRPPARWISGEIVGFEPETHTVTLGDGRSFSARFVVVALGSEVRAPASLPGGAGLLAYKSTEQFEECKAALERRLAGGGEPETALVVGGGISGVEIAGELAYLDRARPSGWRAPKVVMVHGGERLLPGLTARAGIRAAAALRAQGVELHLETRVVEIADRHATIRGPEGEQTIPFGLGFWGGGLVPPPVLSELGLPMTDDGWLRVGPTLQCFSSSTEEPEIFAGGDVARVHGGTGRWPTMRRAIEGIFAAQTIAANILELARCSPDYPGEGVPPLMPHTLWSDFPHGVSIGGRSLIVYGRVVFSVSWFNVWFRRFLMRRYMRRYGV
ncbi:NADH dehydrogenase [Enhygromyxa salina]|uniref:NADH dehydrogenase n=1 Tax=Enhygromyxa salina TaxID=215803 RepID=A0A2S9YHJ2_9BACT|nr:FAD-dependent oxidoreductase [Enhygromyxa salina]PRQ04502.1 NADH dehydrogenase [Enhygromyxa salina]